MHYDHIGVGINFLLGGANPVTMHMFMLINWLIKQDLFHTLKKSHFSKVMPSLFIFIDKYLHDFIFINLIHFFLMLIVIIIKLFFCTVHWNKIFHCILVGGSWLPGSLPPPIPTPMMIVTFVVQLRKCLFFAYLICIYNYIKITLSNF